MSKIFVIAGNKYQAEDWIKKNLEKRAMSGETTISRSQYVYVDDATKLRGIRDPRGVFIGTWRERWDIREVVETLMIQSIHVNPTLGKIWGEVKHKVKPTPKKQTAMLVFVEGVLQAENQDYSCASGTIIFNQAPPSGSTITLKTVTDSQVYRGDGFTFVYRLDEMKQAISSASDALARAINEEAMRIVMTKINGGTI